MPRIVTEPCVGTKHGDCVEVCPVDCFFELDDMLVINPDECTDCAACEDECPVSAIVPDDEADENDGADTAGDEPAGLSLVAPVPTSET